MTLRDWIALGVQAAIMLATLVAMWERQKGEIKRLNEMVSKGQKEFELALVSSRAHLERLISEGHSGANKFFEQRISEMEKQIAKIEDRRAEDFERLHKKATEAVQATHDNMQLAFEKFPTKESFDMLVQQFRSLESRFNAMQQEQRQR